jgi:transposase-like protein
MKGKRRRHDPIFKARAALEAIKGIKTIQEIARDFDIQLGYRIDGELEWFPVK